MQGVERKAYKYRFDPTEDQAREYVYNSALALGTEAWFECRVARHVIDPGCAKELTHPPGRVSESG